MKTWEILVVSIASIGIVIGIVISVVIVISFLKKTKVEARYKKMVEELRLLIFNRIPRGLHRLNIVSRVNIEYLNKYKKLEKDYEYFYTRTEELQKYGITYNIDKKKINEKIRLLSLYEAEVNILKQIKVRIEDDLRIILKSDQNLDEEIAHLKKEQKKVTKKISSIALEINKFKPAIKRRERRIYNLFKSFEENYKNVNWESCSKIIEDVRNAIVELANNANNVIVIDYYLNKWIPKAESQIKKDNLKIGRVCRPNQPKMCAYNKKLSELAIKINKLRSRSLYMRLSINNMKEINDIIVEFLKISSMMELEIKSYKFFEKYQEKIDQLIDLELKRFESYRKEIQKVARACITKKMKKLFQTNFGTLFKSTLDMAIKVKVDWDKIKKLSGRNSNFFDKNELLKTLLLRLEKMKKLEVQIHRGLSHYVNTYRSYVKSAKDFRNYLNALVDQGKKRKIPLDEFMKDISSLLDLINIFENSLENLNINNFNYWKITIKKLAKKVEIITQKIEIKIFKWIMIEKVKSLYSKISKTHGINTKKEYHLFDEDKAEEDITFKDIEWSIMHLGSVNKRMKRGKKNVFKNPD